MKKELLDEKNKELDSIFEEIDRTRETLYHARETWQTKGFEHEMTERLIKGYEEAIILCHKNIQVTINNFQKREMEL